MGGSPPLAALILLLMMWLIRSLYRTDPPGSVPGPPWLCPGEVAGQQGLAMMETWSRPSPINLGVHVGMFGVETADPPAAIRGPEYVANLVHFDTEHDEGWWQSIRLATMRGSSF